ncbi:MAG: DNA-3-methyladenine glycosylase 2 family protein [Patescibacteria group bacterium]
MEASLKILKKHPHFGPLIKKHGPPDFTRYHGRARIFTSVLRSIISQQISTKAAAAIRGRFLALFPKSGPTPETLLKMPVAELRAAGLSAQKVAYMRDAALKFKDGTISPRKFARMTSQEIIDHLVQIKGVGVWTAHMLLIFTLMRPDILPTGDLGIRKGFQVVYGLRSLPDHKRMEKLAQEWREHASVASWYLWKVIDTD